MSLGGTLLEKLNAIAAAGFDGVEIFENDLMYFDGSPSDVRRIVADLGLRVLLFQPFRDFEAAPRARMAKNFDRAELKFDVMEQLGADLMLVCSNTAPDTLADDSVAAEDLRTLGERAARRGFRIGYEALAWGRNVNKFAHAWKIVQEANHPAVGLVVDSFHTFAIDDDDAETLEERRRVDVDPARVRVDDSRRQLGGERRHAGVLLGQRAVRRDG